MKIFTTLLARKVLFTAMLFLGWNGLAVAGNAGSKMGFDGMDFCGSIVQIQTANRILIQDVKKKTAIVRLAWIFAPEVPQSMGFSAQFKLNQLVRGKDACVKVIYRYPPAKDQKDDIDRLYGNVYVKDMGDIGLVLLQEGLAWHYVDYAREGQAPAEFASYAATESMARERKIGLWADPSAIPPWVFQGKSIRTR